MEQSIVKTAALPLTVPIIGIRSISDTAEDALDPIDFELDRRSGQAAPSRNRARYAASPALLGSYPSPRATQSVP